MSAIDVPIREAPLISASRLLAERGFFGIVWLDAELQVTGRYGPLVAFVSIGTDVTETILPFAGLEADLLALRSDRHAVLDIPSVTIVTNGERTPRLNLAAVWSEAENCILILASRAVLSVDLEVELNRQIRARLIAEADVVAKSVELQHTNAELERANTDLEQFASVISHDLKAPMRELRFLADDVDAMLAAGDIDRSRTALAAMRQQSGRMSAMLSSLLAYATAAQKVDVLEDIDTAKLVAAVVNSLPRPPKIRVEIAGDWPQLTTFGALLDLVLRNVIGNALAHHDRADGHVTVHASELKESLLIEVSDDGPGIDPAHYDAIFLPFRTLGDPAKGEPSGMGLAIVARALSTVGGRITVHSDALKTRGTTFSIWWPKSTVTIQKNCPTPYNVHSFSNDA